MNIYTFFFLNQHVSSKSAFTDFLHVQWCKKSVVHAFNYTQGFIRMSKYGFVRNLSFSNTSMSSDSFGRNMTRVLNFINIRKCIRNDPSKSAVSEGISKL